MATLNMAAGGLKAKFARLSSNARGALWLLLSALFFTGMTLLIKMLRAYPPPVQALYSQVVGLLFMLPLVLRSRGQVLRLTRPWVQLGRSLSASLGVTLAYYAVQHLTLADANALSFTRGLWLAPLAALILRDRVSPGSWAALVAGFVGVLLIAQPASSQTLGWAQGAAILSAFFLALSVTGIKLLTRSNSVASIMVWSSILGVFLLLPFAIGSWRWPSPGDFGLLVLLGAVSLMTSASYIHGMALGEAATLASVDYVRLPLAVLIDFLFFGFSPSGMMLLGAIIVIATAIWAASGDARSDPSLLPDNPPLRRNAMPLIDPVPLEQLPEELAAAMSRGRDNRMLSSTIPVQIWAHRPKVALAWLNTIEEIHSHGILAPRLRELVRLKIAAITKCSACEIARKSDEVSEDDIACLTWDSPRFSPAEQAALHYAELFAFDYFAIDERIYKELELHFSTAEIVELNMFSALMLAGGRMTYVQRGYPEQATEAVTAPAQ